MHEHLKSVSAFHVKVDTFWISNDFKPEQIMDIFQRCYTDGITNTNRVHPVCWVYCWCCRKEAQYIEALNAWLR